MTDDLDRRESDPDSDTVPRESRRAKAEADTLHGAKSGRVARRHPDIEMARLLVKRGLVPKAAAVEALKIQKARAKAGKQRVPFLRQLVKRRALSASKVEVAQDEIRRNTYLCDNCNARAVILAGSQSRAGACPRCGHMIAVEVPSDPNAVPVREFTHRESATDPDVTDPDWRPMGSRYRRGLPLGELAFERYLVQSELGRGAMGVVYRAQHMQLDKPVALKVLFPDEDQWQHQVARFRREASAVQKLRHPGIVGVHDFGGDGEIYYLTMDLVPGGKSLHTALKNWEDPPSLRWRLEVLVQVARAAAHAHEHGVIHRDLKPANVLIHPEKGALVADFGLAKDEQDEGELTRTHDRLGTPLFMAPEQIRKGASSVDRRADIWALGVMLFSCVTGRYPFRSRTVMDLYLRILRHPPDWHGDKYSAPDRVGFHRPDPDESAPSSVRSVDIASDPLSSDTEISTRDSAGEIPKTLPDAREGITVVVPPPFAKPPELSGKNVPEGLRAIISCALAKDPEDRYPTADAFADDIERFLTGAKVQGGGPKLLKRLRMQLWRRRVLRPLALGMTILATVVAVFGGIAYKQREAELKLDRRVETAWAQAGGAQRGHVMAESSLSALLREAPDHPRALLRRGTARLRLLRFGEARADLVRAHDLAQNAANDPVALTLEVGSVRARLELVAGEPQAAFEVAQRTLDLAADEGGAFLVRVDLVTVLGIAALTLDSSTDRRAQAEIQVGRLAAEPGAAPELLALHGRLALARGDVDAARERLLAAEARHGGAKESLHLDVALLRPAVLLAETEDAKDAMRASQDAYPSRAGRELQVMNQIAFGLYQEKRWEENLIANEAVSRLSPWAARPHYFRGNTYLGRLCDGDKALAAYREAVSRDPFDSATRDFYLALLLMRRDPPGRLQEAAAFYEREERQYRRGSPTPPLLLAYVLIRQGKWQAAWRALDRSDGLVKTRGQRRGLRSALGRAAILRLATPEALGRLRTLGTWQDRGAYEWEALYFAPYAENLQMDGIEVARIHLEAGQAKKALSLLDSVTKLKVEARKAMRMRGTLLVLKARALAALGKRDAAIGKLRTATRLKVLAPSALPAALKAALELKVLETDPAFRAVLEDLPSRRRS